MPIQRTGQAATRVFNEAVEGLADFADYLRLDPVPPVWRELKRYSVKKLRADVVAGFTVAIVTIPQAIGFALIVGIPVQAVLVTAIIGAAFCAIFSSSRHLVFGPTNTISIILAGALITVASVPLTALQKVLVIGCLMGSFQLAAGFFKLGNLTHFISRTVIIAYSTAVGVLIAVGQLSNLFGLGRPPDAQALEERVLLTRDGHEPGAMSASCAARTAKSRLISSGVTLPSPEAVPWLDRNSRPPMVPS